MTGDGEPILTKPPLGRLVPGGGGAVKKLEMVGTVLDAVAQHFNDAPLGHLSLKASQKLVACRAVLLQPEGRGGFGLGGVEKTAELDQVKAMFTVVIVVVAGGPAAAPIGAGRLADGAASGGIARVAGEGLANEAFQAPFGGVGGHGQRL